MSEVSHKFNVSTKLANFCEKEAGRFVLNGVSVSPAGAAGAVSLVATDGRRLAATIEEGNATRQAVIKGDALKLKGKEPIAAELNGALKVSSKPAKRGAPAVSTEHTGGEIEGRFPRYKDIFPTSLDEYVSVVLDSDFLSEMAAAIRPAGAECTGITIAIPKNGDSPAIFQFADNLGILMPMEREKGSKGAAVEYRRALVRHGIAAPEVEAPAVETAPPVGDSSPLVDAAKEAIELNAPIDVKPLEAPAPVETAPPTMAQAPLGYWRNNVAKHGIEIKFPEAPPAGIRAKLRGAGFHWSARKQLWYAPVTDTSRSLAEEIATRSYSGAPHWTITPSAPVNLTPIAPPSAKPAPAPVSENVDEFLAMIGG
jgi:hypothetical protein